MQDAIITENAHRIPLAYKPTPRAKRLTLRYSIREDALVSTYPPKTSFRALGTFLEKCRPWIERQAKKATPPTPLTLKDELCLHGTIFQCKEDPLRRRPTLCKESQTLFIPPRYIPEDLLSLFKKEAHTTLAPLVMKAAEITAKRVTKVTIRDQSSRWGSCSESKTISLNWRLLLAPPEVAAYVCTHEVAHLTHMNHSKAFWALVESLHPLYKSHRKWLKQNGGKLMGFRV